MDIEELRSLQIHLSAMDSLDLAFLFVDSDRAPLFLSSRAAALLDIRERDQLEKHFQILAPLLDIASAVLSSSSRANLELPNSQAAPIHDLHLQAVNSRRFNAIAFARPFDPPLGRISSQPTSGAIVVFHELTLFEPFFKIIEQSRRNRALIVLGSAVLGRSLSLEVGTADIVGAYQAAEDNFFRHHPGNVEQLMFTDLLTGLSLAVEIVDPLIVPTAKILLDVKTPALLAISIPNFLRIVSHLLLEAADFVGPFGTTRLTVAMRTAPNMEGPAGRPACSLELMLYAQRLTTVPLEATPIELYIYRRYMPLHYKVTVADDIDDSSPSSDRAIRFGADSTVTIHSLSENLQVVAHIAKACGIPLQLKRPQQDVLILTAEFKLHDT